MHATAIARVPRRAVGVCGLSVRFNRIRCTLSLTLRTVERHKTCHAAFDVNPIITCDFRRTQMLSRLTHLAARMAPAPFLKRHVCGFLPGVYALAVVSGDCESSATDRRHAGIDKTVYLTMNRLGIRERVHYPSLIQHRDEDDVPSTRRPAAGRVSPCFAGEDFDAMEFLSRQG